MIVVSEIRCSDCLQEFSGRARFGVVKEDTSRPHNDEERLLGAHLFQVLVCEDCSGWYRDAVMAVPAEDGKAQP